MKHASSVSVLKVTDFKSATFLAVKKCKKCCVLKSISNEYHRSKKSNDGRASWCKKCANTTPRTRKKRVYSAENKRRWQLKTRYNLTPEDLDVMLSKQSKCCAICLTDLDKFHVDHCHSTGVVRGLLCHKCNIRLGGWDDLDWREKALRYLSIEVVK